MTGGGRGGSVLRAQALPGSALLQSSNAISSLLCSPPYTREPAQELSPHSRAPALRNIL